MPQRLRLIAEENTSFTECSICGESQHKIYNKYYLKRHGINYKGNFMSPISPYIVNENSCRSISTPPGKFGYRDWLGIIENEQGSGRNRAPVIERFYNSNHGTNAQDIRIWAFGFDIYNNNKIRSWSDSTMPLFHINQDSRDVYIGLVSKLSIIANRLAGSVVLSVFHATFCEPKGIKTNKDGKIHKVDWECPKHFKYFNKTEEDMDDAILKKQRSFLFTVRCDFWDRTEPDFLEAIENIRNELDAKTPEPKAQEKWLKAIELKSKECFDRYSNYGDFDFYNPRSICLARHELIKSIKLCKSLYFNTGR